MALEKVGLQLRKYLLYTYLEIGMKESKKPESGGLEAAEGSQWGPGAKPPVGIKRLLSTVGGKTLKQSGNSKGPTGQEWPELPRTECDSEGS